MHLLDIGQVDVKNADAWKAAISRLRAIESDRPRVRFDYPEGTGDPQIRFIVYFAVHAQEKIKNGEEFTQFAEALAREARLAADWSWSRSGVKLVASLLKEHWKYGSKIDDWINGR